MKNLTTEQVLKLVKENKFVWCNVLDEQGNRVYYIGPEKAEKVTPEQILIKLENYLNEWPGIYRLEFKKYATAPANEKFSYRVYANFNTPQAAPSGYMGGAPANPEKIREQLKSEILNELEAQRKADELKELETDLKSQIAELNTVSGKFNHLAMQFIGSFMAKNPQMLGALQGAEDKPEVKEIGADYTPEQKQMVNQSLAILLQHITPEQLFSLAKKIEEKPDLIKYLEFLN